MSRMWVLKMWIIRLIKCRILNRPVLAPEAVILEGALSSKIGDYGDQWAFCSVCGVLIHRDMHMFGDGRWRHDGLTQKMLTSMPLARVKTGGRNESAGDAKTH